MKVVFDITNPSGIVTNEEIKSVLSAAMCHEMFMGRIFPSIVHVRLVKSTIRRDGVQRTAELKFTNGNPDHHIIRVAYGGREREKILASIFHEMSHLLRVYNNDNSLDLVQEEVENSTHMAKTANVIEWISSVLVTYSEGDLKSLYEKVQS